MRVFRFFHVVILIGLASVSLFFVVSLLLLLQQSAPTLSKLSSLIDRPAPSTSIMLEPTITLQWKETSFATSSATLLTPLASHSKFFVSLFQRVKPTTTLMLDNRTYTWNTDAVRSFVHSVAQSVHSPATNAAIVVIKQKPGYSIQKGTPGIELNEEKTVQTILATVDVATPIPVITESTGMVLGDDDLKAVQQRIIKLITTALKFTTPDKIRDFTFTTSDIISSIGLPNGYNDAFIKSKIGEWNKGFGTDPIEPKLSIEGKKVTEFVAPKDGVKLNADENTKLITELLTAREAGQATQPRDLVVSVTPPTTSLASLNSLGIEEIVGRGDSMYRHSIPNRVHNVSLTTSKMHAVLVMPGESFSFNAYLGDVSQATGFKQAYVIKEGQTVLGDGGGVCQVSSTLFRAILDAGLPVTERRGHSYRVSYYEQNSKPGFDATVFSPHPDLRFTNDTGKPILLNAQADPKTLTMYIEIWGKKDGRVAEVLDYKQWGAAPPPPTLYQDDPTLPKGTLKQVEYASPGLKTSFRYKVVYAQGETKEQTFATTYTPWRAVYLRGTQ